MGSVSQKNRTSTFESLENRHLLSGYVATDLGLRLGGGPNESGAVAAVDGQSGTLASILDSNGKSQSIPLLPNSTVPFPEDINASADVVGYDEAKYQVRHAFLFHAGKTSPLLEISTDGSEAMALNDSGDVVGNVKQYIASTNSVIEYPAIWQKKQVTTLGPAGTTGTAHDINNAGTVVGESSPSGGFTNAFIYTGGKLTQLPTSAGSLGSLALAVNESNQVVGSELHLPGSDQAVLWSNGKETNLGGLPGSNTNIAEDINDSGTIVGQSSSASFKRAFIWTASGHMIDLNSYFPGAKFTLTDALGINNKGQILALAVSSDGSTHDYLLTPPGVQPPTPPVITPPTTPPTTPPVTNPVPPVTSGVTVSNYDAFDLKLTYASKLNATGSIAALQNSSLGLVAAMRDPTGHVSLIGTLKGGATSQATDIDSAGEVIGDSIGSGQNPLHTAFLWHSGKLSELIHQPGQDSRAAAMNDAGAIVGSIQLPGGSSIATLWANKAANSLGTLGGDSSDARDINNAGQIVGESNAAANGPQLPFYYSKGNMSALPLVPGALSGVATAINDVGQVAGELSDASSNLRATLWSAKKVYDLGTLAGDTTSTVEDMNNSGVIVGQSSRDGRNPRAFVWTASNHMVDLNSLFSVSGFTLIDARGINDSGQIIAIAESATGIDRVYLLTPSAGSVSRPAAIVASSNSTRARDVNGVLDNAPKSLLA